MFSDYNLINPTHEKEIQKKLFAVEADISRPFPIQSTGLLFRSY